jgi:hypothetical protein
MRMFLGETFIELVKDPAHWEFEIMLMVIFDGLIGMAAIPLFKRWLKAHDAKKHAHLHCEDVHDMELI